MAKQTWRASNEVAPVVVTTGAASVRATLPFPGYWLMGVTGTPTSIRWGGLLATFTFGVGTASLAFTSNPQGPRYSAQGWNSEGEEIAIVLLGNAGTVPLSVTVTGGWKGPTNPAGAQVNPNGWLITVQLATTAGAVTSTAAQVALAIQQSFPANLLVTVATSGGGGGTVVAAAQQSLVLPVATTADAIYPVGVEDQPKWRAGVYQAITSGAAGQLWFANMLES